MSQGRVTRKSESYEYLQGQSYVVLWLCELNDCMNDRRELSRLMFERIHHTVWGPNYFNDMKGVMAELKSLNIFVETRYPKLWEYLMSRNELLDGFFTQCLICLFMNLEIPSNRKFEILKFLMKHGKQGLFQLIMWCVERLAKTHKRKPSEFVAKTMIEIGEQIMRSPNLFGKLNLFKIELRFKTAIQKDSVQIYSSLQKDKLDFHFFA